MSLIDEVAFLDTVKRIDFSRVLFVFSFVSMGMEVSLRREDGRIFDLWQEVGIPFLSIHGDSPAYFFDRHVVHDSRYVMLYVFEEHRELRTRLPLVRGLLETFRLVPLDEVPMEQIDFQRKRTGTLLFLKNGRDPQFLRRFWPSCLEGRLLRAMKDMACEVESNLDAPISNQLDDLVTRYFTDLGINIRPLTKLRLFFISQLDDYLRAVKGTLMAEALMEFPVEIRGNNWNHVDFRAGKATYIDECDFAASTQLIRNSLGLIDMSPNTASFPHDRVMRAYGAHTVCLSNQQSFLDELPQLQHLAFSFEKGDIQDKIAYLLAHRDEAIEYGIEVAACYKRLHPAEATVQKLLDCASFVRFDNLTQRPQGSQDFFVWSQRLSEQH